MLSQVPFHSHQRLEYRSEWSRYTKGCDVVIYVVDAAAPQKLGTAKKELHKLLDDGSIGTTPMLVLANKIDLPDHVGESELIDKLALNYVMETPWMVLPISALQCTNVDQVVRASLQIDRRPHSRQSHNVFLFL